MAQPAASFPGGMPGEPVVSSAPYARSGKRQPASPRGPLTKKVTVRKHTRTVTKAPKTPAAKLPPSDQALIDAAVRSRFAPQEQALGAQLGLNARYSSGLGDWYSNALNEIKGLQSQGNQQAQQTLGAVQNYNSTAAIDTPTDQQAAAARNQLNSQYGAMLGRDSNANSAAMDRLAAALITQQGNQRNMTNVERQRLLAQQGSLGQQKADYGLTYGAQLSQAQQKAANDQTKIDIAAKALGIKRKTLNEVQIPLAKSLSKNRVAGQKVARANVRIKKQDSSESRKQHSVKNAQWANEQALKAYKLAHPELGKPGAKGTSPFTDTQIRAGREKYRKLGSYFDPATVKKQPDRVLKALKAPKSKDNPAGGQDPLLAKVYVDMAAYGGTDAKTAKKFKAAYGWTPKIRHDIYDTIGKGIQTLVQAVGK